MSKAGGSKAPHQIFSSLASLESSIPSGLAMLPERVAAQTIGSGEAAQWEKRYAADGDGKEGEQVPAAQDLLFLSTSSQMSSLSSLSDSMEMFFPPIFGFSPGVRRIDHAVVEDEVQHQEEVGRSLSPRDTPRSFESAESGATAVSRVSKISGVADLVQESGVLLAKLPAAHAQSLLSSTMQAESPVAAVLARKIGQSATCTPAPPGAVVRQQVLNSAIPAHQAASDGYTHLCPACSAVFRDWTSCRSHIVFSDCLAKEKIGLSTMEALEALESRCALQPSSGFSHGFESPAPVQGRGDPSTPPARAGRTPGSPSPLPSSSARPATHTSALRAGGGASGGSEAGGGVREGGAGELPAGRAGPGWHGGGGARAEEGGRDGGAGDGGDAGGGRGGHPSGATPSPGSKSKKYRCPECGEGFHEWDACRSHLVFSDCLRAQTSKACSMEALEALEHLCLMEPAAAAAAARTPITPFVMPAFFLGGKLGGRAGGGGGVEAGEAAGLVAAGAHRPESTSRVFRYQCPECGEGFYEWDACRSHIVFSECLRAEKAHATSVEALEALESRCKLSPSLAPTAPRRAAPPPPPATAATQPQQAANVGAPLAALPGTTGARALPASSGMDPNMEANGGGGGELAAAGEASTHSGAAPLPPREKGCGGAGKGTFTDRIDALERKVHGVVLSQVSAGEYYCSVLCFFAGANAYVCLSRNPYPPGCSPDL